MFDPTVFDNLKVAFENELYDLDNLDGKITITNRRDQLELSVMSREFALQFHLTGQEHASAELRLEFALKDLAAELLEQQGEVPGCTLRMFFYLSVEDPAVQCEQINQVIEQIWKPEQPAVQTLSYVYGQQQGIYSNTVELKFNRKINEDQMEDIPELASHMLQTLELLNRKMDSN